MRTIIVYDVGNKLYYQELGDVGRVANEGDAVTLYGSRYLVSKVEFSPALYKSDGKTRRTGFDKLIELLTVLYGKAETVQVLVQSMESIGSADRPQKAGSIILSGNTVTDFDDLIYLRLKLYQPAPADLPQLLVTVHSLLNPAAPGETGSGLTPIVLGEDAAVEEADGSAEPAA